jgi:serine/threonine protein kinase
MSISPKQDKQAVPLNLNLDATPVDTIDFTEAPTKAPNAVAPVHPSLQQIHPILQQNLSGSAPNIESHPLIENQHILNGRYQIKKLLATGGMGEVYLGEHCLTNRKVAIKRLLPELTQHKEAVDRFLREGRAAVKVSHSNVVQVLDADSDEFGLYLIMEYLEGKDFDAWLLAYPQEKSKALSLIYQILKPLAEAHERGLIHRDLKPENLYIEGHGGVKIIDFGIARDFKSANPTQVVGTPQYMSPEQYHNPNACDPSTDVWALGVILYRIVMQHLPFDGPDIISVYKQVALTPIQLATSIPLPLRQLIEACVAKDPKQRPQNAGEILKLWHQLKLNDLIEQKAFDSAQLAQLAMAQLQGQVQQSGQVQPMKQVQIDQKSVHSFSKQDLQHIHQMPVKSSTEKANPSNPQGQAQGQMVLHQLNNVETVAIVEDQLAKVNHNIKKHLSEIEELKKESNHSKSFVRALVLLLIVVMIFFVLDHFQFLKF